MGKILATVIALPLIGVAGAAGYVTWQNIQTYEVQQQRSVSDVNNALRAQGLALDAQTVSRSLFGAMREEVYVLRDLIQGAELAGLRQQVTIEPFRAYGHFGLDPDIGVAAMFLKQFPQLTAQQQGNWTFDGRTRQVVSHYQSGPLDLSLPSGSSVHMAPLVMDAVSGSGDDTTAQVSLHFPALTAAQAASGVTVDLKGLHMDARTRLQDNEPFIERMRYRLSSLAVDGGNMTVSLRGLQSEQGTLVENGVMASLMTLAFDDFRLASASKDLRVDPSRVSLYVDGIDWPALQAANNHLQQAGDSDGSAGDVLNAFSAVGAHGASMTLESLHSSFIFNDLGPAGIGASGDVKASGNMTLAAGEAETLAQDWLNRLEVSLALDMSRSLMQSPLAEYMVQMVNAGYLREDGDRLISNLRLQGGILSANDVPVDGLAQAGQDLD